MKKRTHHADISAQLKILHATTHILLTFMSFSMMILRKLLTLAETHTQMLFCRHLLIPDPVIEFNARESQDTSFSVSLRCVDTFQLSDFGNLPAAVEP